MHHFVTEMGTFLLHNGSLQDMAMMHLMDLCSWSVRKYEDDDYGKWKYIELISTKNSITEQ